MTPPASWRPGWTWAALLMALAACSPLPLDSPGAGFQAFADDFEAGLKDRWRWEVADPARSVSLVPDPLNPANTVLRMHLAPGDRVFNGVRSEAALYHAAPFGSETRTAFRFLIPDDYAESEDWQLLTQWHDQPHFQAGEVWDFYQPLSPPVSLTYRNGLLILTTNAPDNQTRRFGERSLTKGQWHAIEFRVFWHEGSEGWFEVSLDGTPLSRDGSGNPRVFWPTLYNRAGNYFKMGLYRSPSIASENTVYFDDLELSR